MGPIWHVRAAVQYAVFGSLLNEVKDVVAVSVDEGGELVAFLVTLESLEGVPAGVRPLLAIVAHLLERQRIGEKVGKGALGRRKREGAGDRAETAGDDGVEIFADHAVDGEREDGAPGVYHISHRDRILLKNVLEKIVVESSPMPAPGNTQDIGVSPDEDIAYELDEAFL